MKRILINQEETDYFITKEGKVYSEKVKRFKNDCNELFDEELVINVKSSI